MLANKGARPILATGGVERVIKLWDVESGVLLRSLEGHLDQINCLCLWEGYEMLIISGSSDCTLRVYDILSGECLCVLQGHMDAILGVTLGLLIAIASLAVPAISPQQCVCVYCTANKDDPVLVSSSDDLTLIQWSLTDIICDFYNTDDDLLGTRNDNKPDLPTLTYQAPPEIDRNAIPKDERKRLRRETKRLKRLRANDLIKRAVTAATRSRARGSEEGLTGVTEPGKDDGDGDGDAAMGEKKWSDDEDDGEEAARARADRSRDGSEDDGEDAQRDAAGTGAEGAARSPDREPGVAAKEDGACSSPSRPEAAGTAPCAADSSDSHPTLPDLHGLMRRSLSTNKIVPVDPAVASGSSESASVGFTMVKSLIGKMLGIGGTEKVGIDPGAPVHPHALTATTTTTTTAGNEVSWTFRSFLDHIA